MNENKELEALQNQQDQQENNQQTEQEQRNKVQEDNWRRLREQNKYNEELARKNAERAEQIEKEFQKYKEEKEARKQNDDDDDEDDYFVTSKDYKQQQKQIEEERKRIKKKQEEADLLLAEMRLTSQLPDFNETVNMENVKELAQKHPILYKNMMTNEDIYERGYAAYELIKKMNNKHPNSERIEENLNKPVTGGGSDKGAKQPETPFTHIEDYDRRILTEEDKKRNQERMAHFKRMG